MGGAMSVGDGGAWEYYVTNSNSINYAIPISGQSGLKAVPFNNGAKFNVIACMGGRNDITFAQLLQYLYAGGFDHLYIPAGAYTVSGDRIAVNVESGNRSVSLECDDNAIITVSVAIISGVCYGFKFKGTGSVKITGGQWSYSSRAGKTDPSGMGEYCMFGFWHYKNVKVSGCYVDRVTYGNAFKMFGCENVVGEDCIMKNGSLSGFWVNNSGETIADFNNPHTLYICKNATFRNNVFEDFEYDYNENNKWCYPICTGEYHTTGAGEYPQYFREIPLIENLLIENCTVDGCGWEAFDTHSSKNTTFRNCHVHNVYRFLGLYHEGNYNPSTNGGTAIVENCTFENDSGHDMGQMFATGTSRGYRYENIKFSNCVFRGKPTRYSGIGRGNIVFENCVFDFDGFDGAFVRYDSNNNPVYTTAMFLRGGHVKFSNCLFMNINYASGAFAYNKGCILEIENCDYVSDKGNKPLAVFYADGEGAQGCVRYDGRGSVWSYTQGRPNRLVFLGNNHRLIDSGSLIVSEAKSNTIGFVDNSGSQSSETGFGIWHVSENSANMDEFAGIAVMSGRNYIDIPDTTSGSTGGYPWCVGEWLEIDYGNNSLQKNYIMDIKLLTPEDANDKTTSIHRYIFSRNFTYSATVTIRTLPSTWDRFTYQTPTP